MERRHGQARTAAPSLGPYVPYSALAGLRRDIKGMLAPIGPLRTGFRPPPPAPTEGAAGCGPPLLRGCACRLRSAPASPAGMAGSRPRPLGLGCRRLRSPVAMPPPRPPARLATPPLGTARAASALGPSGRPWAAMGGPTDRPPRHSGLPPGPSAPPPRRVPPGRPRPRPALARPSLSWSPGRADGLRSSRPGPFAVPGGDRSLRPPAPGAGADAAGNAGAYPGGHRSGNQWRRTAAGDVLAASLREIRVGGGGEEIRLAANTRRSRKQAKKLRFSLHNIITLFGKNFFCYFSLIQNGNLFIFS